MTKFKTVFECFKELDSLEDIEELIDELSEAIGQLNKIKASYINPMVLEEPKKRRIGFVA